MPYKDPKVRRRKAAEYSRRWAEKHPERAQATQRKYREANRELSVQRTLAWKAKPGNRERVNGYRQAKRYGITPDEYDRIFVAQNGVCAICRQPETHRTQKSGPVNRLSVDHCHNTQQIRGLLCHHCNAALGLLNDDPARLRAAADYIERNKRA